MEIGTYTFDFSGKSYVCEVTDAIPANGETVLVFTATTYGEANMPSTGELFFEKFSPTLDDAFTWEVNITNAINGNDPSYDIVPSEGRIIQIIGKLAAALDFGQGIRHAGNGLEVISFFDDETISIGLPKDVKDKEEIDIEGAKGTISRMIIGAMLQGMSPVVTLKQKDYYLLELIQGGRLDRDNGIYEPPLSRESDHPTFYAEIFSGIYSSGSNKLSDVAGYEKILLRSMIGMEADVPIEAKAWAQYAFNLTATEYSAVIDGETITLPAWQEQTLRLEEFDVFRVKQIAI